VSSEFCFIDLSLFINCKRNAYYDVTAMSMNDIQLNAIYLRFALNSNICGEARYSRKVSSISSING